MKAKNDKRCFFILKALFVLKLFKFFSWFSGHVEKTARLESKVHSKIYDVTTWLINNYNTHIAQYLTKTAKYGQLIEYKKNIFLQKSGRLHSFFYENQ